MRLRKWIESLYEPTVTNFKDAALDDLTAALENGAVRKHWLNALVDELRAINVAVDKGLDANKLDDMRYRAERRRAIIFCLNQILESQTAVDTELYEQHNNPKESSGPSWFGRTVPLDERVDNLATGPQGEANAS